MIVNHTNKQESGNEYMPNITVNIPDTTFVSSLLPDYNFPDPPLIYAGTDSIFQECISFMKIDLSLIPVNVVDSALLELTVYEKTGAVPSPVLVNRVTTPFDTNTVTYNTRPAFTATPSQLAITTDDIYKTVQFDITALVNNWLSGAFTNDGIALTNSDGSTVVQFATNDIGYEPYFPRLSITYSGPPVEPVSAICFSYEQLAHVIEQLITLYPTNTITVYTKGVTASSITGTPYQLYSSPEGTYGALFILLDNEQQQAIPLNSITAIYTGDLTVYDPSITFLPTPQFLPGCDTNLITAYHDYLPVLTELQLYLGSIVQASGTIYKNEYGILVLSDMDGNTPIFVPVINITAALPAAAPSDPSSRKKAALPRISVTK